MKRFRTMDQHRLRRRAQLHAGATINLVSMMDVLTILLFFLLVSAGEADLLPHKSGVTLPESSAQERPKQTLMIVVNDHGVFLDGKEMARIATLEREDGSVIPALKSELDEHRKQAVLTYGNDFNGMVTVVGDRHVPFKTLKRIMVTCAAANYGNVELAVRLKAGEHG